METTFWIIVLSLPILPNLWCIWHASRHWFPGPNEQQNWVRAGTFAPVIGGILYLLIGMRRARPFPVAGQEETGFSETNEHEAGTLPPAPAPGDDPLDPDPGDK